MALQTSGAISLNDIHIELGGTSGTTVSLNDTDVRGLVSISSGAIDLADFYGASSGWTLTEGSYTLSGSTSNGLVGLYGTGSISPTTYNSATIHSLYSFSSTIKGSTVYSLTLMVNGNQSTSWFSSVSIAGTSHAQSSFTRSYDSNNNRTTWSKSLSGHIFDGSGTTAVVFS